MLDIICEDFNNQIGKGIDAGNDAATTRNNAAWPPVEAHEGWVMLCVPRFGSPGPEFVAMIYLATWSRFVSLQLQEGSGVGPETSLVH